MTEEMDGSQAQPAPMPPEPAALAPTNEAAYGRQPGGQGNPPAQGTDPALIAETEATPAQPAAESTPDASGARTGSADGAKAAFPMDALPDLRETLDVGSPDLDPATLKSRDEFTTVYDIIDRLESMLGEAKGGFFNAGIVKVDREEFTDRLDELKKMLPVQLERASALMREAERRLESAQTQANAIVASAQSRAADMVKDANEQAQFLAGQENVTEIARQKARATLDQAQAKSDRLTQGADQYCVTVMEGLQAQLSKLDRDVQAGLNVLYERQRAAGEQLPHLDHNDYPEG